MQLANFCHRDNIEEFKVLIHAHNDIPGLELLQAVELAIWGQFKEDCVILVVS